MSRQPWRKMKRGYNGELTSGTPCPKYAEQETMELSLQRTSERIKDIAGKLDVRGMPAALKREHDVSKKIQLAMLRASK